MGDPEEEVEDDSCASVLETSFPERRRTASIRRAVSKNYKNNFVELIDGDFVGLMYREGPTVDWWI